MLDISSNSAQGHYRPVALVALVEEVGHVDAQRMRNKQQMAELHLLAGLHPLNGAAAEVGAVRESFLGHVQVEAADTDAVTGRPEGVSEPFRLVRVHPLNALLIKIISQHQF